MTSRCVLAAGAVAVASLVAGCGDSGSDPGDEASRCEPENLVWVYDRITEPQSHSYPRTIFRFHEGEETALTSSDAQAPALSPDGSTVVFERGSDGDPESSGYARFELYVMDSAGGGEEPLLAEEPGSTPGTGTDWDRHPVWSPDGSRIAFIRNVEPWQSGGGREVHQVMLATVADRTAQPLPGSVADAHDPAPAWSADGTRLAWITGSTTLHWSSLDGRDRREVRLQGEATGPPAWIDGDQAIVVRLGDQMHRVDVATGEMTELDLGVPLRAVWTMPTGQLAGLDGPEERSRLVVVDPDAPDDVEEITTLAGSAVLPEGSVGDRTRGPVTAAPATPGGWAACPDVSSHRTQAASPR